MTDKQDLAARIHASFAAKGIHGRTDIRLADVASVESGRTVRLLATYGAPYGAPSPLDVREWVNKSMGEFAGQVSARLDSLLVYPDGSFFTVFVERATQRQPLSAATKMIPASPGTFMDNTDGTLWEVVKSAAGADYLVRKEQMSAQDMIAARRSHIPGPSTAIGSSANKVTFASVTELPYMPGGFAPVGLGDRVSYLSNNIWQTGIVQSMNANGCKVKPDGGGTPDLIDPMQIHSILEKSAASLAQSDNVQRDFYSRVYAADPKLAEIVTPNATKKATPPSVMKETVSGFTERASASRPTARVQSVSRRIKLG